MFRVFHCWKLVTHTVLYCLLIFSGLPVLHAQIGKIPIQNYPNVLFDGGARKAFIQDQRGVIYVTGRSGLFMYDGIEWRTNNSIRLSIMEIDKDGVIYVITSDNNLGYLSFDEKGQERVHKITDNESYKIAQNEVFYRIVFHKDAVYFLAKHTLFCYRDGKLNYWESGPEREFEILFTLNDTFFLGGAPSFIERVGEEQLYPYDQAYVGYVPIPYKVDTILMGVPYGQFRKYPHELNLAQEKSFLTPLNQQIDAYGIDFIARSYKTDHYYIPSLGNGLLEFDENFQFVNQFTKETDDLPTNQLLSLFQKNDHELWVMNSLGFSKLQLNANWSYFDDELGVVSTPNNYLNYKGWTYLVGSNGTSFLKPDATKFELIKGQRHQTWDIMVFKNPETNQEEILTVGDGFYQIEEDQTIVIDQKILALRCSQDAFAPHRIWLEGPQSIYSIRLENGKFIKEAALDGFEHIGGRITEDEKGNLWIVSRDRKAYYFTRDGVGDRSFSKEEINLPEQVIGRTRMFRDTFLIGDHFYNKVSKQFEPYTRFKPLYSPYINQVTGFLGNPDHFLWVLGTSILTNKATAICLVAQPNGTYMAKNVLQRFSNNSIFIVEVSDEGKIWFHAEGKLYCYDASKESQRKAPFHALIRQVVAGSDSVLFVGNYTKKLAHQLQALSVSSDKEEGFSLPYTHNAIRFNYAAPYFDEEHRTNYQYRLEGFDEQWSDWQHKTDKEYSNLWEGNYTFKVRAQNIEGDESTLASYPFSILPPWYRSFYAYISYVIVFVVILIIFGRLNNIRLEKKLAKQRQINQKLREADKLKDEFLANTSHELRTPLNGIIGLAESVLDGIGGELSSRNKENLQMISMSGRRLSGLVNDILDFSKMKDQKLILKRDAIDIRTLADVVLMLSKPLVRNKVISLTNEISDDAPLVEADENRLQQILLNLLGNAIKFTESGSIRLAANLSKNGAREMLEISVIDTGIGIPKKKFEQIFQSFEQADGNTAREYGGTGLGLAVTRQLVELHGGEVWLDSEVGSGSTFYFTLPISNQTTATNTSLAQDTISQVRANEEEVLPLKKKELLKNAEFEVLIVDDEAVNLQVLENQLVLNGYHVKKANNGVEALDIIEKEGSNIDLILLDIMMPKMSGYEVCQKIREQYEAAELPIIMLTAKNQISDLITGFESGANDYLTKPFNKGELLSRIDLHLELLTKSRKLEEYSQSLEEKVQARTAEIQQQTEEILTQRDNIEAQRDEIEQQRNELEGVYQVIKQKNDDITDSIRYAEQIQNAILPLQTELKKHLSDHFIVYRPKDIVSGDFYWFLNVPAQHPSENDKLFIAIIDCTGHGVPGAFMSMIGHTILNDIVKHRKIYEPAQILELLDQGIYHALRQQSGTNDDGMDVALAILEKQPSITKVTYVGAKRPLLYFAEAEKEEGLLIVQGTNRAIGGKQKREKKFEENTIELQTGDSIFLTTDGISSQFNEERKKFSSSRLHKFLDGNKELDMQLLKQQLENSLEQYQGNVEQVDDITVVGIRL